MGPATTTPLKTFWGVTKYFISSFLYFIVSIIFLLFTLFHIYKAFEKSPNFNVRYVGGKPFSLTNIFKIWNIAKFICINRKR